VPQAKLVSVEQVARSPESDKPVRAADRILAALTARVTAMTTMTLAAACRIGFDPIGDVPPVLDLQFADRGTLDDAVSGTSVVSFARASTATYVQPDGRIAVATANAPRFDHDPITGMPRGLVVEPRRTNLLLHSDDFFRDAVLRNGVVTADAALSPDGTLTADKLIEPATSAYAREIDTVYLAPAAGVYTQSVFVKAAERHLALIGAYFSGDVVFIGYNLQTGQSFVPPNYVAPMAHGIERYADGWFRIWQAHPSPGGTRRFEVLFVIDEQRSTYTGDGSSGMYVWGQQIEAGDTPSSYIPTGDVAVTRAGDVVAIEQAALAGVLAEDEGSLLASFSRPPPIAPGAVHALRLEASAQSTTLAISSGGAAAAESVEVLAAAGSAVSLVTAPLAAGQRVSTAAAYGRDGVLAVTGGGSVVSERTVMFAPGGARLVLGPGSDGGFVGHLDRISYWSVHLADDAMRALTLQ